MENVKIKMSLGSFTVEVEGSRDFIKSDLVALINEIRPALRATNPGVDVEEAEKNNLLPNGTSMTTSMFAAKISVKTGTDLALAAGYKLTSEGRDSFTRGDVLSEMQSASSYYKANYGKNLTQSLKTLVVNKNINELGGNKFSLPISERSNLASFMGDS